jgi:hypothetical protein
VGLPSAFLVELVEVAPGGVMDEVGEMLEGGPVLEGSPDEGLEVDADVVPEPVWSGLCGESVEVSEFPSCVLDGRGVDALIWKDLKIRDNPRNMKALLRL